MLCPSESNTLAVGGSSLGHSFEQSYLAYLLGSVQEFLLTRWFSVPHCTLIYFISTTVKRRDILFFSKIQCGASLGDDRGWDADGRRITGELIDASMRRPETEIFRSSYLRFLLDVISPPTDQRKYCSIHGTREFWNVFPLPRRLCCFVTCLCNLFNSR